MTTAKPRSAGRRGFLSTSVAVEVVAGAYLLTQDSALRLAGNALHWYGLLLYTVVNVVLLALLWATEGRGARAALGAWSVLGVAAILGDATSGLALSSYATGSAVSGWQYLFGFGYLDSSTLLVSLATTLVLVFALVAAARSLTEYVRAGRASGEGLGEDASGPAQSEASPSPTAGTAASPRHDVRNP